MDEIVPCSPLPTLFFLSRPLFLPPLTLLVAPPRALLFPLSSICIPTHTTTPDVLTSPSGDGSVSVSGERGLVVGGWTASWVVAGGGLVTRGGLTHDGDDAFFSRADP